MSEDTRILVVDDNNEMLAFLSDVIRKEGYDPYAAADGFTALRFMEDNTFHAAIIDVLLPDIDGIELMRKLRRIDPDLAPIVITANGDLEGAVKALNEGAEEYLLKPVNVPEFQAILGKVITRRRTIDQKRHLEEILRRSAEKYRSTVSKMEDAILLVDTVHSRIIDANSKAQQMTGYKIQELLKMSLYELFPEMAHPELKEIIKKIKRRKQDIFSHLSIKRGDGTKLPIEAHAQLIRYKNSSLIQFICHDISRRKEIEEKKWHSQRFTTFSEMADLAKDQVSSPLTAIRGQTEVLKSRLNTKNSAVAQSLRSIEEQVNRVKSLLDNLDDFAHLHSGGEAPSRKAKMKKLSFGAGRIPSIGTTGKHKILVVDDEPAMCQVLEDFFTMNSFDVITSQDGEEGLKRFKHERVDLVLTDLTMPKMDGVGLLKQIKNDPESVPVILMTGLNLNQIDGIAKKYGADGYIVKPFSFYQVIKLVQQVLAKNTAVPVS